MKLPPPLSWLWAAWLWIGKIIGMVMNKIILTMLWLVGFGLYAIILAIVHLFVQKAEAPGSYWNDVPATEAGDLHRQF